LGQRRGKKTCMKKTHKKGGDMEKNYSDGDFGVWGVDPAREEIAEIEAEKIQPTPPAPVWGSQGTRYDEVKKPV